MPKSPRFERRFSQKETARILRKAAEMQSEKSFQLAGEAGISSDEVIRVGEEVGLDRELVQSALDSIEEDDDGQSRWLGAPPFYETERTLEGTLSDYQWQALVGELNSAFQQSIEGVVSGPVRTWHWKHTYGSVHFSATQLGGSVRLKTVANIDDGISSGLVPTIIVMCGGSFGLFAVDSFRPWISLILAVAFVLGLGLWFRRVVSNWFRKDRRKMHRLMDRLEGVLKQHESNPLSAPAANEALPASLEQRLNQPAS